MRSVEGIYLSKLSRFESVIEQKVSKCPGAQSAFAGILSDVQQRMTLTSDMANLTQAVQSFQSVQYSQDIYAKEAYTGYTGGAAAPDGEIDVAIEKAARSTGLDPDLVRAVIRVESSFRSDAVSGSGAQGLMQLMPGTARWVARKIGLGDFRLDQVDQLETNITLGTHYLNMVLQDLGGSQALATAAYNAGPRRPRAWRATLARPVEGAIFAESIPFTETRDYVKKVLSNATYYAALFEGKPQSLKARLGTVAPNDDVSTDLP